MLSSMLASPLPPYFLDTYSLSTSSLGCCTLCMVISFLVLWSICLSSPLVHFIKGLEYLTRGTTQVFILLIRFRQLSFVSSSFLVLIRYSFWICLSFPLVCSCQPPRCPSICRLRFLWVFYSCLELVVQFRQLDAVLPLFITSIAQFFMTNSIPMSWVYILTECIRVSCYFSFFANSLMSSMYIRWLIFLAIY